MQLELGRSHVISQRYPGPLTSEVTQLHNRLHHPPLLLPLASLSLQTKLYSPPFAPISQPPTPSAPGNKSPMSSVNSIHPSSTLHCRFNPQPSNKQKRPVKLTLESLRAHDAIEKPRSSIKRFASNTDPYSRFAATGSSSRPGLDVERGLKAHQRGVLGGNGSGAESSKKSQKKDVKQKEGQNNKEQDRCGRDGGWNRG